MSKGRGTVWKRPETGRWSLRVDLPPVNGKRREARKHGFATRRGAVAAMDEVIRRITSVLSSALDAAARQRRPCASFRRSERMRCFGQRC